MNATYEVSNFAQAERVLQGARKRLITEVVLESGSHTSVRYGNSIDGLVLNFRCLHNLSPEIYAQACDNTNNIKGAFHTGGFFKRLEVERLSSQVRVMTIVMENEKLTFNVIRIPGQ